MRKQKKQILKNIPSSSSSNSNSNSSKSSLHHVGRRGKRDSLFIPNKYKSTFMELQQAEIPIVETEKKSIKDILQQVDYEKYGHIFEKDKYFNSDDLLEKLQWLNYQHKKKVPFTVLSKIFGIALSPYNSL